MRIFRGRKYRSGMLWCVWRWTDVDPDGDCETYLTRLHLFRIPWCSCMLHWIARPDPQPDLHDHPVSFLSIVLCGSYVEEIPDDARERRTVRVRWWNFKHVTDRHRIVSVTGRMLTLVFAGPAVREWGFHTPEGWVPWRANADRTVLLGNAEATAIRARAEALGTNPNLIALTQAEKWNGVLPTTMVPGSSVPFLNLSPPPPASAH